MKKITLLLSLFISINLSAQTDINFDTSDANWVTFMNVSNLPAPDGDGAFQFGNPGWGVPDLVALVDQPASGDLTLKPNRINDSDPYWQTGNLSGNKIMDANFYIQDNTLAGTSFTFNGSASSTLNNMGMGGYDFTVTAFIKVFESDYSSVLDSDIIDLRSTSGDFTLTMDATGYAGKNIQYGFQFIGPNVSNDPTFDAAYDALGSVVVSPNSTLGVNDLNINDFSIYPNPSNNVWNINGQETINEVQVHDVLGKRVMTLTPKTNEVSIDASTLPKGLYFAKMTTDLGSGSIKLIKN
ncbi:MAG: T9SS type A sorting domain-containing protein [Flavobacteriaceae bacterium]|nr:T9SS type A sorting domain-containing protein [Flavobacteriaceae bacterium]